MYIEFYGLPGAGKTTLAEQFNKKFSKKSYSYLSIFKAVGIYLLFLIHILVRFLTSLEFFINIIKRPIYFLAFLKGMFVRLATTYRYERQGIYISDHGLLQMLSQNDILRKELVIDRNFLAKILRLFPRDVTYVYLRSTVSSATKRTIVRDRSREFSDEFMAECDLLFEIVKHYYGSQVINGDAPKSTVQKNIKQLLEKKIYK